MVLSIREAVARAVFSLRPCRTLLRRLRLSATSLIWADLTCSPRPQAMTGICAKRTAGVDVWRTSRIGIGRGTLRPRRAVWPHLRSTLSSRDLEDLLRSAVWISPTKPVRGSRRSWQSLPENFAVDVRGRQRGGFSRRCADRRLLASRLVAHVREDTVWRNCSARCSDPLVEQDDRILTGVSP